MREVPGMFYWQWQVCILLVTGKDRHSLVKGTQELIVTCVHMSIWCPLAVTRLRKDQKNSLIVSSANVHTHNTYTHTFVCTCSYTLVYMCLLIQ